MLFFHLPVSLYCPTFVITAPEKHILLTFIKLIHTDLNGRTEEALKTFRKGSKDISWLSEHGKTRNFRTLLNTVC